jgi:cell division protein FtsI/penicillin-binding protein 2
MAFAKTNKTSKTTDRIRLWYGLLILVLGIFGIRLFYIQVIRYDHYKNAALNDQLKQYQIPATRGTISVNDGTQTVPFVLNQKLYTLYVDPIYIKNTDQTANKVAAIIGGNSADYAKLMRKKGTRYVVIAKRLDASQSQKLLGLKIPGLGTQAIDYRIYPQGSLAAQVLGFVDSDGNGRYGIEQALNKHLKGIPGQVRAVTDVNGVPLAASRDNVATAPKDGNDLTLTIDLAMQQQLEAILKKGAQNARASGASALIMDANSGAVKAMANYPTYNPADYYKVSDGAVFQNDAVAKPIEVGSTMKALTTAAALDQGVVEPNTTYHDPASWVVDGFKITNIEEDGGAGTRNLAQLLNLSLNTGATWLLMQMGGGQIDSKARNAWHDYLVNHYMFGKPTGIEQGYEATGYIPGPADNGAGIDLTYANMSFGQAMTATPIQMGAALSAVVNGGTYYKPYLVDKTTNADDKTVTTKPKVIKKNAVSPKVSQAIIPLLQNVVQQHHISPPFDQNAYVVGGKTGTAQIAKPGGGYYDHLFNGTYTGFVGGDKPQYVIVVFVDKPTIGGYAGTAAAQPIFAGLAHMLIDNSYVMPKSQ